MQEEYLIANKKFIKLIKTSYIYIIFEIKTG